VLHYVQVLLAICRGCFLGKIGHIFKDKKQPILRLKVSILTELQAPSYVLKCQLTSSQYISLKWKRVVNLKPQINDDSPNRIFFKLLRHNFVILKFNEFNFHLFASVVFGLVGNLINVVPDNNVVN